MWRLVTAMFVWGLDGWRGPKRCSDVIHPLPQALIRSTISFPAVNVCSTISGCALMPSPWFFRPLSIACLRSVPVLIYRKVQRKESRSQISQINTDETL